MTCKHHILCGYTKTYLCSYACRQTQCQLYGRCTCGNEQCEIYQQKENEANGNSTADGSYQ